MNRPFIDSLDLRRPVVDPWDFPRFPRRVQVFIDTGRLLSREEVALWEGVALVWKKQHILGLQTRDAAVDLTEDALPFRGFDASGCIVSLPEDYSVPS